MGNRTSINGIMYNTSRLYFLRNYRTRGMIITTNQCGEVNKEIKLTKKMLNSDKKIHLKIFNNCTWKESDGL